MDAVGSSPNLENIIQSIIARPFLRLRPPAARHIVETLSFADMMNLADLAAGWARNGTGLAAVRRRRLEGFASDLEGLAVRCGADWDPAGSMEPPLAPRWR